MLLLLLFLGMVIRFPFLLFWWFGPILFMSLFSFLLMVVFMFLFMLLLLFLGMVIGFRWLLGLLFLCLGLFCGGGRTINRCRSRCCCYCCCWNVWQAILIGGDEFGGLDWCG